VETSLDSNPAGLAEAFQFTAGADGSANQLTVYIDPTNTATTVVVGLYKDSAGSPQALLTQATITNPIKGAWDTVTVPPAPVTAGGQYWIAVLAPSGTGAVQFRDRDAGGRSQVSAQSNLVALPATWTPGTGLGSGPISAYVAQAG
jgi:hypothetical protein